MNRLILLPLILTVSLWQSCATGLTQIRDDIATVAAKTKAGLEKGEAFAKETAAKLEAAKAAMDAKLDAARADLAAKGAPVDGTPAELTKWAAQNPGTAFSSIGGFLLVLAASVTKYRTAKRALTASVDAVEGLSPTAAAEFKANAASSTNMGAAEAALIAALKSR